MSKNVFRVGDVVYHCISGKGRISKKDQSKYPYHVEFGDGHEWVEEKHLSFSPWPAPNHTRPIQEGWWIVFDKKVGEVHVRELHENGRCYNTEDVMCLLAKEYDFIRYLGKDWRTE